MTKPGRKSQLQLTQEKLEASRLEQEAAEASLRATPLNAQRAWFRNVGLVLGAAILVTSALFSFPAVATGVGEWMKPPFPWLQWVVPGFLETFIIFFGVDALYNSSRATNSGLTEVAVKTLTKQARSATWWMLGFSTVAVIALAAHTLDGWANHLDEWQAYVGIAFSGLAPLGVVLITKRITKLAFRVPGE